MKKAIGKYEDVRAITREEALAMAPTIFNGELWRQTAELGRQIDEEYHAYSPDWRAINFIAADRLNAVYCFVYCTTRHRNEIWIYNGETCPDARTIKKWGQVIWAEETPKPPLS